MNNRIRGVSPDKTEVSGSSPEWPTTDRKFTDLGQNRPTLYPTERSPRQNAQSYPDTIADHSLCQLIDGFILSYRLDGKSPLTIDSHQRKLNRFFQYIEANSNQTITPTVIRSFLGYVRGTYNLDAATVQRYLITLKAFWRWAVDEGFVTENPTARIAY